MSKTHRFLISYIADNQPTSITVESSSDSMTPDEARAHVLSHHDNNSADQITDIQVEPVLHPDSDPGHNYQP